MAVVVVAQAGSIPEAEQICMLLRSEGIEAYYTNPNSPMAFGDVGGHDVLVEDEHAERARELIGAGSE